MKRLLSHKALHFILSALFMTPTVFAQQPENEEGTYVKVNTNYGDFTLLLYDKTSKHRANFMSLVKEGFYDSTLFHRVIPGFMVQGGDPDSKGAKPGQMLGQGGPGYLVDAEIYPELYVHKRGALSAARQGDQVNPAKRSSGSQFYIVTGSKVDTAMIGFQEQKINVLRQQALFMGFLQSPEGRSHLRTIDSLRSEGNNAALKQYIVNDVSEAPALKRQLDTLSVFKYSAQQRETYMSEGGAPHLDGDYTVFGEIVEGMDVIDKISQAETGKADRPKEDVIIVDMEIINK